MRYTITLLFCFLAAVACRADDTALVQGWIDAADVVELPAGTYHVKELDLGDVEEHKILRGAGMGHTVLRYCGNGGAGSYVVRIRGNPTSGAMGTAMVYGVSDLTINGYNETDDKAVESGLLIDSYAIDFATCTDRLHIKYCVHGINVDALVVNYHTTGNRWDCIGKWPLKIKGASGSEGRPCSITEWTYDNGGISSAAEDAVQTAAGNPSDAVGYGLVGVTDGSGLLLTVTNGRFEGARKFDAASGREPCIVQMGGCAGNLAIVTLDTIGGFLQTQGGTAVVFPDSPGGLHARALTVTNLPMLLSCSAADLPFNHDQTTHRHRTDSQGVSTYDGRAAMAYAKYAPGGGWDIRSPGDITRHGTAIYRAYGDGSSCGGARNLIASVTLAADATTVTAAAGELRYLGVGYGITIPGAGTNGADLDAVITGLDRSTGAVTFDPAIVTAVTNVTITNNPLTWTTE